MTATSDRKPAWQAELTGKTCWVPITEEAGEREDAAEGTAEGVVDFVRVRDDFVDVFQPGGGWIRFRVNRRKDRHLSFTDYREQQTGTAGNSGIWGTLPPQQAGKPRSLTLAAFRLELAGLVGTEGTDEILSSLTT